MLSAVLAWARRQLPKMSVTEEAALFAGEAWWEASVLRGKPEFDALEQWSYQPLTAEEQAFLSGPCAELCALINDWEISHHLHDLPENIWTFLKEKGFLGLIIPKNYGGLGFSARLHSEVVARITTHSVSVAVTTMVPNSLGPAELLIHYGTEAQKDYYLPRLAKGQELPCFALTSPEAGSDAASMIDKGVIVKKVVDGQESLCVELSFNKRYITLAPVATIIGLAFHCYDPDHLLGSVEDRGITIALIPRTHPGVEIGARHQPMYCSFMNGPIRGDKVCIPLAYILGGEQRIGQGWLMLMECLSAGRGISLPALSAAAGALCMKSTGAYAHIRHQFKRSIGSFEGVEQVLARIAGLNYLLQATRLMTIMGIDQGKKPVVASGIAKYHMTEWARMVINDAMDVHGGRAIMNGPRNYLASLYQSIPIMITVEGANILTRNLIIFGQGSVRCHPFLMQEMQAMKNNDTEAFKKSLVAHIKYSLRNTALAMLYGWTRGLLVCRHSPRSHALSRKYVRRMRWMSCILAVLTDASLLFLGGSLKKKESLSARLGDILSYLYCMGAVLHYFKEGKESAEEAIYVDWVGEYLFEKIHLAVKGFLQNFSPLLRWILLPFGTGFCGPRDSLTHALATQMQTPGAARDRLTELCGAGQEMSAALAAMEEAFLHPENTALQSDVLQVDDFKKS